MAAALTAACPDSVVGSTAAMLPIEISGSPRDSEIGFAGRGGYEETNDIVGWAR
jgi:hypothetical protein